MDENMEPVRVHVSLTRDDNKHLARRRYFALKRLLADHRESKV